MPDQRSKDLVTKEFKLRWNFPEGVRAVFANHLLVSHQEGQFILNFAEAVPPPLIGDASAEDMPDEIDAQVFLRVAVPTARIPGIIRALQRNYDGYLNEKQLGLFDDAEGTND